MRKLRVPVAIAFVLIGCSGDDGNDCSSNPREPCVQEPNNPIQCPQDTCIDSQNMCPEGCIRASSKFYCVPDNTDAGCPSPAVCIVAGQTCPSGCQPVG